MLATAGMILLGFPPLILGSILLELERAFGWPFYDTSRGGDPVLWQHLFWLFGHPEVYLILLPAVGLLTMYVPVHARRPTFLYGWLVAAAVGTGFLAMGLWVHHMYAAGIPQMSLAFFSAASTLVAIPLGIQVFSLIATVGQGRPVFRTPLLFAAGFVVIFVLGGLTGVMLALVPFDLVAHDTQFVVAHLHYVLIGGSVFPLLGALHHWWPLATGRMPSERTGRLAFRLLFVGFDLDFLPLHHTGLAGMPRRVYPYPADLGWEWTNLAATAGAAAFALGALVFLGGLLHAALRGPRTPDDPWREGTLEWTATPPAVFNFRAIPVIEARYPLWDQEGLARAVRRGAGLLPDPLDGRRLSPATTEVGARPEMAQSLPGPTWIPLVTALCVAALFIGVLAQTYAVAVAGAVAALVAVLAWMWPAERDANLPAAVAAAPGLALPLAREHHRAPGWTALWVALVADASLLASLAFAFFFLWGHAAEWPPAVARADTPWAAIAALAPLVLGMLAMWWAERAIRRGRRFRLASWLAVALAAGGAFLALQAWAGAELEPPERHARDALSHFMTLYRGLHIALAMAMAALALARAARGLHAGSAPRGAHRDAVLDVLGGALGRGLPARPPRALPVRATSAGPALLAPPLLWAAHFLAAYVFVSLACLWGWHRAAVLGLPLAAAVVAAATVVFAAAVLLCGRAAARRRDFYGAPAPASRCSSRPRR
jgi:cytochrome c oxidase subunit I+III